MLHVNNRDGFTIAVSENRMIARIAQSTVLSDNAFSILIPILERIVELALAGDPRAVRVVPVDGARVGEGADRSRHAARDRAARGRLLPAAVAR